MRPAFTPWIVSPQVRQGLFVGAHMSRFPRMLAAALTAAAIFVPAASAQVPTAQIPATGADYVTSPDVEYLGHIVYDVGQTTGARIIGNRLYVTSAKNLSIYDISKPETPQLLGTLKLNIAWENEEVPTNGKILGIANDWFDLMPSCNVPDPTVTHCQQLFDVRDPANIKELPSLPNNGDHTSDCAFDCDFLFGNTGNVTDLRGVLDGKTPDRFADWHAPLNAQLAERGFKPVKSCHHIREISPGYMFAACQPYVYFHVSKDDLDNHIVNPQILDAGMNPDGRFVHSVRWPRDGQDKFAFEGGETNFTFTNGNPVDSCDHKTNGAFAVVEPQGDGTFSQPIDEYRPVTGTYTDGNTATHIAGCSVHWFQEHPSFHNGGLVALAAYDNGVRFLQITPTGHIVEQGYFQPLGFETSSAKWVPGTDIVYSIDYARGIDILRWKGSHYVPDADGVVRPEPGTVAGTHGKQPILPALTAKQKAFAVKTVSLLHAQGWFYGYCQLAAERGNSH
jgi:hypothetical protein